MKQFLANDGKNFKLVVRINDCDSPKDFKHLEFVGEQYNDKGEKIAESTYDFFLTESQVVNLGEQLKNAVA